jgi:DNA-binding phage protein
MPLKTTKFDVQDYLKTPDQQAAYLEAALMTLRSLLPLSEI